MPSNTGMVINSCKGNTPFKKSADQIYFLQFLKWAIYFLYRIALLLMYTLDTELLMLLSLPAVIPGLT